MVVLARSASKLLPFALALAVSAPAYHRVQVERTWYPNGKLRYERSFKHGREHGLHRVWWENGQLRLIERFENGFLEGEVREWLPDGTIYRQMHYDGGQEAGRQRMWYEDGTPRANYVVRAGRRFGLLGAKGCTGNESEAQ
jgi:antitoxin component YwqK of YwqJK toxin-antitoxin module